MSNRTPIQSIAALVGVVFLLVGVLGFVPGITTDDKLFGVFEVSILHDIVHLLLGAAGLALARTADGARTFLVGAGVAYLVLWLLGVVGAGDWIPVNTADNWLHLLVGIGILGLGFVTGRATAPAAATS